MKLRRRFQTALLVVSILLASLHGDIVGRQTTPPQNETFKFGKVDLDLLEQIDLLDKRFEKEGLVYHDDSLDAYLSRVGESIIAGRQCENVNSKVRALRDPVPNAFALPNGSIYVHTGLLALLDDEGQLAGVLAHEVTHVSNRHTYAQNRSMRKKVLAINILNTVASWNPVGGGAGLAIDLIANVSPFMLALSVFGYSRELEKEADIEGVKSLTAAGYPPEEMVSLLKLLQKDIEGEQLSTFYSDHPKLQDRVLYVSNGITTPARPRSDDELKAARTQYLTQTEKVDQHDVELAINRGRFHSAVFVSQKLVDFHPESSVNNFYLAESYRALGPRAAALTTTELTSDAKRKAARNREKRTVEAED